MVPTAQLKLNEFRLPEVDNRCILPSNYNIRILTTSMDSPLNPSVEIEIDSRTIKSI